jgi:hypothetical protein
MPGYQEHTFWLTYNGQFPHIQTAGLFGVSLLPHCYCIAKYHAFLLKNWIRGKIYRMKFLKLKKSVLVIERAALRWLNLRRQKRRQQAAITIQVTSDNI